MKLQCRKDLWSSVSEMVGRARRAPPELLLPRRAAATDGQARDLDPLDCRRARTLARRANVHESAGPRVTADPDDAHRATHDRSFPALKSPPSMSATPSATDC